MNRSLGSEGCAGAVAGIILLVIVAFAWWTSHQNCAKRGGRLVRGEIWFTSKAGE